MKRRKYLKTSLLGSLLPVAWGLNASPINSVFPLIKPISSFKSDWHLWGDMNWVGPDYWGNRLQDWRIEGGKLICDVSNQNRNLALLTVENQTGESEMELSVLIRPLNSNLANADSGCIGFRIGLKGPNPDYRSAAVFGKGIDIGITPKGDISVDSKILETGLGKFPEAAVLKVITERLDKSQQGLTVLILNVAGTELFKSQQLLFNYERIRGTMAILSDINFKNTDFRTTPSVTFEDWNIEADLINNSSLQYGPICFAQYTLHKKKLKITAQFAPIEKLTDHRVKLEFRRGSDWILQEIDIVPEHSRALNFVIPEWNETEDIPYRIVVEIPVAKEIKTFYYEGTICQEPIDKQEILAAVFSCNFHYGFPDSDIQEAVLPMNPDVVFFLGDQFYEGTGGFGVQYTGEFDKTCLDYLRKWMMFGWSYREIFKHRPCAIIPDDHDVYHGNVWGESGKKADTSSGFGSKAQDSGGYKMEADWLNMIQFTQTSHLPDAYDPRPVSQGISVYFTSWHYAGLSFAILEDRKFKSAPKNILPESAEVFNGWIMSDDFDIKEYRELDAELLGSRQEEFLENWVEDWSDNTQMKVVLSQTNFATMATIPKEAKNGSVIPGLPVPEKGEYVLGDKPTVDMDSNGWPPPKRDKAISIIRKGFAFHIAGDQHLGSFIHYGVDEFGDSGHVFAGPALNNIWPRRFWPPIEDISGHTYEDPSYVGDHYDGFGNKMTVKAVANPYNGHKEPKVLHDRSVGYGIITFNKKNRTIKTDCFKRFYKPTAEDSQYPGWPITIQQNDNFAKKAQAYLPVLKISGDVLPVIKIYDENQELIYALRLSSFQFTPKVFSEGKYTIHISVPETGFETRLNGVKAKTRQKKEIEITIS